EGLRGRDATPPRAGLARPRRAPAGRALRADGDAGRGAGGLPPRAPRRDGDAHAAHHVDGAGRDGRGPRPATPHPLHSAVEPDRAARAQRPLRLHTRRAAGRPPGGWTPARRGDDPPHRPCVRAGNAVASTTAGAPGPPPAPTRRGPTTT